MTAEPHSDYQDDPTRDHEGKAAAMATDNGGGVGGAPSPNSRTV